MKVTVLLSAFNGAPFIREQIDSILKQTGVEVSIIVRNDGSTDNTAAILSEYQAHPNFSFYSGSNIGWAMSFMDLLLQAPDSDYYAFCDHDDIWLAEKLSQAVECLNTLPSGPQLYASNLYYYKDGKTEGLHRLTDYRLHPGFGLVRCIAYGCTCVFNRELAYIVRQHPPRVVLAHDYWMFQTALLLGKVYFDNRSYILYRQHPSQQIGAKHSAWEVLKRRLSHVWTITTDKPVHEQYARELLHCYASLVSDENKDLLTCVAHYHSSIRLRMRLIFSPVFSMGRVSNNIIKAIRILIHRF